MITLAAFEPFGGRRRNQAWEAARRLDGVHVVQLPTAFARLRSKLEQILAMSPEVLVLVGESSQARTPRVEAVALNIADARIPDNDGAQPRAQRLDPRGPPARLVRFDPMRLAAVASATGVRTEVSFHAGVFCCNAALYHALALAGDTPVAFVHVPARWPWACPRRAARALAAILREMAGSQGRSSTHRII